LIARQSFPLDDAPARLKTLKTSALMFALIVLSGCATNRKLVLNEPIGPSHPAVNRWQGDGYLIVHSAREVVDLVHSDHPTHSAYTVYTDDVRVLRRIRNLNGSFYQDPENVQLPVGSYKVEARALNSGWVVFPVIIEEGKTTVVYLDGEASPREEETGDWVRLPNGQIIGSRARAPSELRQSS
jgi:hypothetical protein